MTITLKKDGFTYDEWVGATREYKTHQIEGLNVIKYWENSITIDEGVTLSDLVEVLKKDDELATFVEMLTDCNIKNFFPSLDDPIIKDNDFKEPPLTAIEMYKYAEIDNHDKDYDLSCFHLHVGCHGRSTEPYIDKQFPEHKNFTWAIEMTPWNELKHLPLKLNEKLTLTESNWIACEPRAIVVNMPEWTSDRELDSTSNRECICDWTVNEFFNALFNELSFFGSPQHALETKGDLMERMEDVKERYDLEDDEDDKNKLN